MSTNQISFVSLDKLVAENHQYRKFKEVLDFSVADKLLEVIEFPAFIS